MGPAGSELSRRDRTASPLGLWKVQVGWTPPCWLRCVAERCPGAESAFPVQGPGLTAPSCAPDLRPVCTPGSSCVRAAGEQSHSHEKAGESFCVGALREVPPGQRLEALPAPEVLVNTLGVTGVLGRGRRRAPGSSGRLWPGADWDHHGGQLGGWGCSSGGDAQGPASLASLGAPESRGRHAGLPRRGSHEEGGQTRSSPAAGPWAAPVDGGLSEDDGLSLGGLRGPPSGPNLDNDIAGPGPDGAKASSLSCHQRGPGESGRHQGATGRERRRHEGRRGLPPEWPVEGARSGWGEGPCCERGQGGSQVHGHMGSQH